MNSLPRVAVVILTFNRWQDTRTCLDSLTHASYPNLNILVVDNASTDNTPALARQSFPEVNVVSNAGNLGYAAGNNVGIEYALQNGAEYVAVLNNDVRVAPDWLEPLVNALETNPTAAFAGPLVYHADEPNVIQSGGGLLSNAWVALHRAANERDIGQLRITEPVDWLTGCAMLVRGALLPRIGLLDPAFYMYGEDVDWCVRARHLGYPVLFVPQSHVWHSGVMRAYEPGPNVTYYSARNELQLIRKHHAGTPTLARAYARHLRTLASWSLRPRWREKRAHRDALARALGDSIRGATGRAERNQH